MSDSAHSTRPVVEAYRELERIVRGLTDELATFRRRALQAESRLRAIEERAEARASTNGAEPPDPERLAALERENAQLRARLDAATERTRRMLDRVRFLRQQQITGGER